MLATCVEGSGNKRLLDDVWGEQETVSVAASSPAHSSEPGNLHNQSIVVLQWIKSVDDRGQTYYYLRDGSRSLWTLPEVNGFISGALC